MAKDGFNREIDYLRISVTDRCNLSCIYCMPGSKPRRFSRDELLTAEEIERIARVAVRRFGVRKIRLTGGEPLLRKDILGIISAIKGLGVRDLSLTTNGVLLSGMARGLRQAGLDRVNVSLDTLYPARYREITGGGELSRPREGIRAAEAEGLAPVKINMVPMRGVNDDEIADFARLTLRYPCHIRFIEFMPSRRASLGDRSRCVRTPEVMQRVSALGPLVRLGFKGRGPSRNYYIQGAKGMLGFISPVSHSFCYACSRLRINASGRIRPCLFSRETIDLRAPMRNGAGEADLERLFARAIEIKPRGDYLNSPVPASIPSMWSIGG